MYVENDLKERIYNALSNTYDMYMNCEDFKYITYPEVKSYRYAIGDFGTVYDIKRDCFVAQCMVNKYLRVGLEIEAGGRKQFSVHRLVAWEFNEGYDEESGNTVVNHIDSHKTNNSAYNLEWCTYSHNSTHAFNNDYTYSAKRGLSKKEVKRICELFEDGYKVIEVFRIISGLRYKSDDEKLYKKIVRIHTRTYYNNVSKNYKW